jgi:soluble lytic murein transglycosylase-like protein
LQPIVDSTALRFGVDSRWVTALIEVESGFNPRAVSPKGAIGLMQLMPATAARYGVVNRLELFDPERNLDIGVRHLQHLLREHDGNLALAMASYNAGSGAVAKHGNRIPRFNETMLYVPAVLAAASRNSNTSDP